jgi:hypothetical protein
MQVTGVGRQNEPPLWELGYRASAGIAVAAAQARERLAGRAAGFAGAGVAVGLAAPAPADMVGAVGIAAAGLTLVVRMAQGDRRRRALDHLAELGEPPVDPAPQLRQAVEARRAELVSEAHRQALACTVQTLAERSVMTERGGSTAMRTLRREPDLARQMAEQLERRCDVRLVVAVERFLVTPDRRAVEPVRRLVA